jgi:uncharacterized membrane protein SpoIIM required for sporulation/ABC-type transport system involved in multi-copper enzyme maturation permease subunit
VKYHISQIWLVASRELRDQMRDWRIIFPMIALTVFFPFLMIFTARFAVDFVNKYGAGLVGERMVPFLLMVVGFFPVTVALVVALEAFVGEKERGTIEPLLSSPLADWHLYLGKLFAGTVFPLVAAYLGISVYLYGLHSSDIPLPDASMLAQTLVLTTAQGILMVSGAILISAQSTTVRGANLLASFIIIPIALLIQAESILMFWGTNEVLWLAVIGVTIISALLIRLGLAHFRREGLIGREIDMLNIRYMGVIFKNRFLGGSRSFWGWYQSCFGTLYTMRFSILAVVILGFITAFGAYYFAVARLPQLLGSINGSGSDEILNLVAERLNLETAQISFRYIFFNNIRAMVAILIFGALTLSVGGMLAYILNIGLVGGVLGLAGELGFSPGMMLLVGILPHGLFEITAIVLACAAVLHMGVVLVTPDPARTISQVLVESIADWFKVMAAFGIPLLVIAAGIESNITPQLIVSFLK